MSGVAGNCNAAVTQIKNPPLKGKRDRDYGRMLHSERERFPSEEENLHDYLEKEARRALHGECMARRRLSEGVVEMDRRSWRGKILIWLHAKAIVSLKHSKWSFFMQSNGLDKLIWKPKNIRTIIDEEQTSSRKSRWFEIEE